MLQPWTRRTRAIQFCPPQGWTCWEAHHAVEKALWVASEGLDSHKTKQKTDAQRKESCNNVRSYKIRSTLALLRVTWQSPICCLSCFQLYNPRIISDLVIQSNLIYSNEIHKLTGPLQTGDLRKQCLLEPLPIGPKFWVLARLLATERIRSTGIKATCERVHKTDLWNMVALCALTQSVTHIGISMSFKKVNMYTNTVGYI